jgi:DNA-binding transcriptional ArsR family regulator
MRLIRNDAQATRAAEIIQALANPTRLRLLAALCSEEGGARALATRVGVSPATARRHLDALVAEKLLAREPGEGEARYRVLEPALYGLVACMEECAR